MLRNLALVAFAASALLVAGCGASGSGTEPADIGDAPAADYDDAYADDSEDSYVDDEAVAQEEWEYQEGKAWEEFDEGYLAGWEVGCDIAFEGSPDGYLYLDGDQYSAEDCYALAPFDASDADIPYEVPYDPYSEGEALGETDGCNAAFDELSYEGALYWGEDYYDSSVCP